MKKLLILLLLLPSLALAATPPITASQGGLGTSTWQTKSIPFFTGFRFTENNSAFNFLNAGQLLTVTNASTTNLSATVFCLIGDTCRTTWPTSGAGGGSGNVATSTAETAGTLAYWTSNSATPALLGKVSTSTLSASSPLTGSFVQIGSSGTLGIQNASASQGGAIILNDYQRLYTATTTFTYPLTYTGSTNAVTFPATSTLYGSGTAGQVLMWSGVTGAPTWAATSSSAVSSIGWPFTPSTNYGVAVQSTTTPEWFQNGMDASSTSYFVYASSTAFTTGDMTVDSGAVGTSSVQIGQSGNPGCTVTRDTGNGAFSYTWTKAGITYVSDTSCL